ncbi:hypothetical protein B0T20DRAFT_392363 [Sordaria brevicollis]|uniref:Uncharacterized protein n=1 Tax=Sordaria brevicollis TaxID=83679 RepID=A0AAE0UDE9_SORBR|nr:hypothetical protein B0T20DRAFT_392363 [Sordaria brevicollis]
MGLPLYRSPSTRRREAEQAAAQQQEENARRARTGAPVPMLRREDAQRLSSQTPSIAGVGTQENPFDLTSLSIGSEDNRRAGPAASASYETPIQSREGSEPMDLDNSSDAVSVAMSNYARTRYDSSELATPTEEEELRLPNYGTPDLDWSTPEIDATSTPPRAPPRSSPPLAPARSTPRASRSSPPVPFSAPQPQRHRSQLAHGPSPTRARYQQRQAIGVNGGRGGFVQVVNDDNLGPIVRVAGSRGQAITRSRRLPALPRPRPADATIRGPRQNRRGQFVALPDTSANDSGSSGDRSLGSSSRRGN